MRGLGQHPVQRLHGLLDCGADALASSSLGSLAFVQERFQLSVDVLEGVSFDLLHDVPAVLQCASIRTFVQSRDQCVFPGLKRLQFFTHELLLTFPL